MFGHATIQNFVLGYCIEKCLKFWFLEKNMTQSTIFFHQRAAPTGSTFFWKNLFSRWDFFLMCFIYSYWRKASYLLKLYISFGQIECIWKNIKNPWNDKNTYWNIRIRKCFYYGYLHHFWSTIKDLFQKLNVKHCVKKILNSTFGVKAINLVLACTFRCFPISYEY